MTAGWALWPLLALASGAYSVLPGSGYLVFGLALLLLLLDPRFGPAPGRVLRPRQLAGWALFNAVFLAWGVWHGLEARLYVLHLFTLGLFLLAHACAGLAFPGQAGPVNRWGLPEALSVAGLALLLAGQLAQCADWLPHVRPPAAGFQASLVFRPGGFQNSNMTAALALLFLWLQRLHRAERIGAPGWLGLVLVLAVIGLTQSRAGLLSLALYAAWIFRRHPWRVAGLAVAAAGAAWWSGALEEGAVLLDLLQRFLERFGGDESSDERAWLLRAAWRAIQDSPLLGQGYQILEIRHGAGSHNQLIELVVSFGVVGAALLVGAGALLLWPCSGLFVALGVLPSLLFSHNYFESAALQAALGMALAMDRLLQRSDGAVKWPVR